MLVNSGCYNSHSPQESACEAAVASDDDVRELSTVSNVNVLTVNIL